jgi:hypothetical protein
VKPASDKKEAKASKGRKDNKGEPKKEKSKTVAEPKGCKGKKCKGKDNDASTAAQECPLKSKQCSKPVIVEEASAVDSKDLIGDKSKKCGCKNKAKCDKCKSSKAASDEQKVQTEPSTQASAEEVKASEQSETAANEPHDAIKKLDNNHDDLLDDAATAKIEPEQIQEAEEVRADLETDRITEDLGPVEELLLDAPEEQSEKVEPKADEVAEAIKITDITPEPEVASTEADNLIPPSTAEEESGEG